MATDISDLLSEGLKQAENKQSLKERDRKRLANQKTLARSPKPSSFNVKNNGDHKTSFINFEDSTTKIDANSRYAGGGLKSNTSF